MKKIWLLPCTIFLVLCFSCSKEGEMDLRNKPKKIANLEYSLSEHLVEPC